MQWEFSPEEVIKGRVGYGLDAFRHDLFEEIAINLGNSDAFFLQRSFDLIYDLCYWEATGRTFTDFVNTLEDDTPFPPHTLLTIKDHMQDNVTMLGAILQRLIMDGVEQGLPVEQAVAQAAQHHALQVDAAPPAEPGTKGDPPPPGE